MMPWSLCVPRGRLAPLLALIAALLFTLPAGGARSARQSVGLIAFTRGGHVYVMNADGSGVRALACGEGVNDVAWSPDGERLACGGPTGIRVLNADGSGATGVSAHHMLSLSWSPDGRRIAFSAQLGRGFVVDIAVMDADGSNLRRLTHTPKLWENNVDWNPAGGFIAFDRRTGLSPGHVCVMKADGTGLHDLNPTRKTRYQPGPYPVFSEEPDWSPDGRRIAFSYFDPHYGLDDIWIMDADGKGLVKLTHNWMEDGSPAWSPDGHRIAYVRSARYAKTSEIVVMNADGSAKRALTHGDYADRSPAWQPLVAP
jgi:TolB protein